MLMQNEKLNQSTLASSIMRKSQAGSHHHGEGRLAPNARHGRPHAGVPRGATCSGRFKPHSDARGVLPSGPIMGVHGSWHRGYYAGRIGRLLIQLSLQALSW